MPNLQRYIRGQVWWQRPTNGKTVNGVQNDGRPVIIISNNAANRFSTAITVVPLTTAVKKDLPTHMKILMEDGKTSTVLGEQIRTVSVETLDKYIGTLDEDKMIELNRMVAIATGLQTPNTEYSEITPEEPEKTEKTEEKELSEIKTIMEMNGGKISLIPTSKPHMAKRFSKNEVKMIERYLKGGHSVADTVNFFSKYCNISHNALYQRVSRIARNLYGNR